MCTQNCNLRSVSRDLPGGPVVKNPSFHCRSLNSIPDWGTKIPHALWCSHKKKNLFPQSIYGIYPINILIWLFCLWVVAVQSLSCVQFFVTPWTAAHQLTFTISQSLLKLMSIELAMHPTNHLILCHPFLLLLSIFPSVMVFSSEWALCIRCPKYWSFSLWVSLFNNSYLLPSPDQKNKPILNLIGILPIYA